MVHENKKRSLSDLRGPKDKGRSRLSSAVKRNHRSNMESLLNLLAAGLGKRADEIGLWVQQAAMISKDTLDEVFTILSKKGVELRLHTDELLLAEDLRKFFQVPCLN